MNAVRRYLAGPGLFRARETVRGLLGMVEGFRLERKRRRLTPGQTIPGLVSVVVPAYDVEAYLDETLESLQRQNYRSVEIIVVDDGSPDDVANITRRRARLDSRIRLVQQQNRGLSGARNAGTAVAVGEYIVFIDSDDTVDRHIFTNAVASLERTGSDFAVYPYRRYFKSQYPPAAHWIREAHAQYRGATTLREFPEIMVNAVAWSKVYRRSFWDSQGFAFPEGLLYEDQALSCRAFGVATGFDVLSVVSINWRIREDQSSISQKLAEPRNIHDHTLAVKHSISALRQVGLPDMAEERLVQVLSYNLGEFVSILGQLSEESWQEVVAFADYLRHDLSEAAWEARVPTRSKVVVDLILDGKKAELLEFLAFGGWTNDRLPYEFTGSELVPDLGRLLPGYIDRASQFSRSYDETSLRTSLVRVTEGTTGNLALEVDFFVPSLDPKHIDSVQVSLVADGLQQPILLHTVVLPLGDQTSVIPGNYWEVRRARSEVSMTELDRALRGGAANLRMVLRAGDLEREQLVRVSRAKGPVGAFQLQDSQATADFAIDQSSGALLIRRREAPSVELLDTAFEQGGFVFTARSSRPIESVLLIANDEYVLERAVPVRHEQSGEGILKVRIPRKTLAKHQSGARVFRVLCKETTGEVSHLRVSCPTPLVVDNDSSASVVFQVAPDQLRVGSYREGSESVEIPGGAALVSIVPTVWIDMCVIEADAIVFTSSRHSLEDVPDVRLSAYAQAVGRRIEAEVSRQGNAIQIRVPIGRNAWEQDSTAAEPGSYTLMLTQDEVGTESALSISQAALMTWVPLLQRGAHLNVEVKRSAQGNCMFVIRPPLAEEEGGANGYRLKNWYEPKRVGERKKQVLFRSLYGEVANDSALAVFHELRKRNSSLDLIWSIRDHSVAVPEGALTVIDGTRAFYEAFAESEYLMVNVHQPEWTLKPQGQKIIETFHGYPFKLAGRRWWDKLGFPKARVESFMRRALEWDYLVSPAPYATEHLRGFLPADREFPGEILEIGYPRNDVLLSDAGEIRRKTRERLGIAPEKKVLLYGPTFRDYLSADDMSAKLVEFLDVDELAAALGEEWTILLRGHPFNARHGVKSNPHVLNMTYYPEINDLILASDAGLLDYSSLRFDYALTDKPMLFLTPDKERYFEGRESFEPYDRTSPGPHLQNTGEVIQALKSIDAVGAAFATAREEFRSTYMPLEDGNAAARLVDAVFVPNGDADPA